MQKIYFTDLMYLDKNFNKLDKEGLYLNIIKVIYDKPTVKIIFKYENLKLLL